MAVTRFPARAEGLADRMVGFCAHLRMNGLALGPEATGDALAVLGAVEATDVGQARRALKVLLSPDHDTWRKFDDLFDAYWFNAGAEREARAQAHLRSQSARPMLWQDHFGDAPEGDGPSETTPGQGDGEAEGADGRLISTLTQNLRKRDLREVMDEASLREAEAVAYRLARAIRDRRSRRRKAARKGAELDLRRTLRASLARGGEPLDLRRRHRPDRPVRIIALADISGSMSAYARPFLAFVKGLIAADTRAEAFVFHTRLMQVTSALRDHDSLRAAGRLSLMAEGFGGGTDIGGALGAFMDQHGQSLGGRTVVIILSDGYCTGTPAALGDALARIGRRAGRVIWLNPLLGWRDYDPVSSRIAAAMPHLDAHLPANTIEALAELEPQLARV